MEDQVDNNGNNDGDGNGADCDGDSGEDDDGDGDDEVDDDDGGHDDDDAGWKLVIIYSLSLRIQMLTKPMFTVSALNRAYDFP